MGVGKGEMERVLQELEELIGNREEGGRTIVGGDFNARLGKEGGGVHSSSRRKGELKIGRKGKGGRKIVK